MSWQDRDIKKLKQFVKSFGLKLYFRPKQVNGDLALYVSGEYIVIFVTKNTSKTEIILSLLHELGHHLDWITNKRLDKDTEKAYTGFSLKDFKKYFKIIVEVEKAGIRHMTSICKILDLEIPIETVKRQQKIDLFHYQFFYKNKRDANTKETKAFENKVKYGKKRKK